ncbi:rnhA, partial [Mucuna pruriens]
MALSEYDIVYVSQKAITGSALAEHLAHHPILDNQPLQDEFPNEYIITVVETEPQLDEWIILGFDYTNNMAKYEACALGIMMALDHQVKRLKVCGDSALVIYQLHGEWETRDAKLIPYRAHVKEMLEHFDKHILREENLMADALATSSTMIQVNEAQELTLNVQHHSKLAYYQQIEQDEREADGKPWYYDIKQYLKDGEYSDGISENDTRTLRRMTSRFFLSDEVLYKSSAYMTLLRCLDAQEAK